MIGWLGSLEKKSPAYFARGLVGIYRKVGRRVELICSCEVRVNGGVHGPRLNGIEKVRNGRKKQKEKKKKKKKGQIIDLE